MIGELVWLRGQSCASQNDDGFSSIVGQALCERENFKERLASTNLKDTRPFDGTHHRNRMALHFVYKHAHVWVLHVRAVKQFLKDKFQFTRSQFGGSNRPEQGQRDFTARRDADFTI